MRRNPASQLPTSVRVAPGLDVTGKGTFRGVPDVWLEPKYGVMPQSKVTELCKATNPVRSVS